MLAHKFESLGKFRHRRLPDLGAGVAQTIQGTGYGGCNGIVQVVKHYVRGLQQTDTPQAGAGEIVGPGPI